MIVVSVRCIDRHAWLSVVKRTMAYMLENYSCLLACMKPCLLLLDVNLCANAAIIGTQAYGFLVSR